MNKYDRLPEHMREGARDYVEDHDEPGGFLLAVLRNDLVEAFGHADAENRAAMGDWALWLWNDIPQDCWGSKAKVEAWLEMHPGATLVGGRIPAHRPGAYQNLSCCGGETQLRPMVETVTRTRPAWLDLDCVRCGRGLEVEPPEPDAPVCGECLATATAPTITTPAT